MGVGVRGDVSDRYRQVHFCGAIIPLPLDWHEGERGELRGGGGATYLVQIRTPPSLPITSSYSSSSPAEYSVNRSFLAASLASARDLCTLRTSVSA